MGSNSKKTLLLLSQHLNDLKSNLKPLVEESLKYTKNELFVYINPSLKSHLINPKFEQTLIQDRYKLKQIVNQFYQYSFKINPEIKVTCLLHNVHQVTRSVCVESKFSYDQILTDFLLENLENQLDIFLSQHLPNMESKKINFTQLVISKNCENSQNEASEFDLIKKNKVYRNSVIGGTYDRLHPGHKILLSESVLLTKNKLLIGVSDGELLSRKKLSELIENFDKRCENLKRFLAIVNPDLNVVTQKITDPYGPSITEPDYQCIIVSRETSSGGEKVNEKRVQNNLNKMDIHIVDLINDETSTFVDNAGDEIKISSSNQRRRLLGTLIKPPYIPYEEGKPYVIGLTGGLASGKSHIIKDLEQLGAAVVDSDKLGHKAYDKGTDAYYEIIRVFGSDVLDQSGDVNRKILGKKVFDSATEMKKLTNIVWPEIRRLRDIEIKRLFNEGNKIIVVEAAVMLEAKWHENVNEIWVVFVPEEEAISRAMERDGSSLDKVKKTLRSQMPNAEKIEYANVVFCSLWERKFTIKQVEKAWNLLLKRTIING
ncbi:bifunctional coenzyme A synthase [Brachionus plicatilis]|uniref:Bifunctional coenzyme A synthase n=1 Tax=Brachionus plicatilis TaxID=10195 RepID=A0A3M7P9R9_BRAPC|nr:bifunctional coenzyme A synthase [Brachionus plicatilis]